MAGFRAYYDFSQNSRNAASGDIITLDEDESRHLCGSLRAAEGEMVDVFDLCGNVFSCRIKAASQKRCAVEIAEKISAGESAVKIYLAQALPKGKVFDEIIRQSVEVGAAGIIALQSDHSIFRTDDSEMRKKYSKWKVHVIEAIKQSANFLKFDICQPQSIKNFFQNSDSFDLKLVASLQPNARPILDVLEESVKCASVPKKVCILIGPEGDLSDAEYAAAAEMRFKPVKLGENVMKCDTAALCSLSVLKAFFDSFR